MMGIERNEKINVEELGAGYSNISETIRETTSRLLGHVKKNTKEDVM